MVGGTETGTATERVTPSPLIGKLGKADRADMAIKLSPSTYALAVRLLDQNLEGTSCDGIRCYYPGDGGIFANSRDCTIYLTKEISIEVLTALSQIYGDKK